MKDRSQTEDLLAGQIRVMELIASGSPLKETLTSLALLMESQAEGMIASILLLEEDGRHIRHGAAPSLPNEYNESIRGLTIGPKVGSCGTAMYLRKQVIVSDIQSDPLWEDYRDLAAHFELRACWSSPIFSPQDEVLGSFAMYYRDVRIPNASELRLIDVAAHTASIAIEQKRSEEALLRDFAARMRAEEEVRKLNAELEQRVADRTNELVATNHELEAFSYSLSHDLRGPLRSIDGFSRILLQDHSEALGEKALDHLKRIRSSVKKMSDLVDAMLKLSRISAASLQVQKVDLSRVAATVSTALQSGEGNRQVEFQIEPGLCVAGDRTLLTALLENLMGNAWKFTSATPNPTIEVGELPTHETRPGERAFYVKDNGAGFATEQSDSLFRPFTRLHSEAEFEGTGIGLATVERIVLRHGGRVWADGRPEEGATFYFTLREPVLADGG